MSRILQQKTESNSFVGNWIRTQPDTALLEFIRYRPDSCEFKITCNNGNYSGYIGGDMYANKKYVYIDGDQAYFNDSNAISDGRALYYQEEEPCELIFTMTNPNALEVSEKNCYLIYGGAKILWSGKYIRVSNNQDSEINGLKQQGPKDIASRLLVQLIEIKLFTKLLTQQYETPHNYSKPCNAGNNIICTIKVYD